MVLDQCSRDFAANGYRFRSGPKNSGGYVVADLINETLRPYPTTKRVYGRQQTESPHGTLSEVPVLCSADIESLHRSQTEPISTLHPTNFNIARWAAFRCSATGEIQIPDSFMSFGFGTLACSTRADFAPKVIIILVAGLYDVLRETANRRRNVR